jgi:hypothetical protein
MPDKLVPVSDDEFKARRNARDRQREAEKRRRLNEHRAFMAYLRNTYDLRKE